MLHRHVFTVAQNEQTLPFRVFNFSGKLPKITKLDDKEASCKSICIEKSLKPQSNEGWNTRLYKRYYYMVSGTLLKTCSYQRIVFVTDCPLFSFTLNTMPKLFSVVLN